MKKNRLDVFLFRENRLKIIRVMKLVSIFLLTGFLHVTGSVHSQTANINLSLRETALSDVIKEIQKQTEFTFFFSPEDVNGVMVTEIELEEANLEKALDQCLKGTNLAYEIVHKAVILKKEVEKQPADVLPNEPAPDQPQKKELKGKVTDEMGQPLPGVSVVIKGTTTGVITDTNGYYILNNIPENAVLQFSFVGMKTKEIKSENQPLLNVKMQDETVDIKDVVVTALGIKKDAKALGYSISKVNGEDVSQAHETNAGNALAGKVAGVFVSRPASGAAGSSKVLIRGNNSLRTNSQPLYVVDGIPMTNNSTDAATNWGGFDYGDGISNINPEDIESMSVLKGPNATALYGQRGSNGVILITTKSGKTKKSIGVNFTSDLSIGNGLILPDFQNEYGQGYNGNFTHFKGSDGSIYTMDKALQLGVTGIPKASAGRDKLTRGNWGAKMDGQQYEDQYGQLLKFDPQPNTYSFFNPEKTYTNNLSLDGGTEKMNYRFSVSNTHNDGYVPTNKMDRNTFNLKVSSNITSKLQFEGMANYINQKVVNRPHLADSNDNPAYLFISMPRNIPLETLKNDSWTAAEIKNQLGFSSSSLFVGEEKVYATNSSTANPYWTLRKQHNEDQRDRLIGYFKLSYTIAPWLKVIAKTGTDFYVDQKLFWRAEGTYSSTSQKGDLQEYVTKTRETNSDILFSSNFKASENINISLNAGGNRQKFSSRKVGHYGNEFIIPDLHVINNIKTLNYIFDLNESAINSVYATGQMDYKNYLYVDLSARNDWSSTLPVKNNSFFYPSVALSFIASDALKLQNNWLNFLKIRASVAQAGSSGDPYALLGNYSLDANKHGGIPLGSYTSTVVDPNLKNELTTSYEGGFDLNLFKNRLIFNFTCYKASTKNQILSITLPSSTTFNSKTTNAGEIQNQGIELMVSGTPVKTNSGFTWESSFNFSRNRNKVVELIKGVDSYILAQDRGIYTVAEPGKPFGQVKGVKFAWIRDEKGNRLIDSNTGLPLHTPGFVTTYLGSALPDWLGGLSNTFTYKGFKLYALIDISQGGIVVSQSTREEILYGTSKKTLQGRDGTYVAEGMVASKDASGNYVSTGVKNTKQVTAQAYWNVVATDKENFVSEEMVNDLSYISMREISLSYSIPKKITEKTFINSIVVGVYGRNLFYFQRKTDGFSPEACSFNVQNSSLGIESTSLPLMRTIGFNVSIGL